MVWSMVSSPPSPLSNRKFAASSSLRPLQSPPENSSVTTGNVTRGSYQTRSRTPPVPAAVKTRAAPAAHIDQTSTENTINARPVSKTLLPDIVNRHLLFLSDADHAGPVARRLPGHWASPSTCNPTADTCPFSVSQRRTPVPPLAPAAPADLAGTDTHTDMDKMNTETIVSKGYPACCN